MTCIQAPTCRAALAEATRRWPGRSTLSDGICSSPQHQAQSPNSDHDTGDAFDLTHDPDHGCDAHAEARRIVARHDNRAKYVISKGTIWRGYDRPATKTRPFLAAWQPEPYTGPNPHDKHAHISIWTAARDDTAPWFPPITPPAPPAPTPELHMDDVIVFPDDSDHWWWLRLTPDGGQMVRTNEHAAENWVKAGAHRVQIVDTAFATALEAKLS